MKTSSEKQLAVSITVENEKTYTDALRSFANEMIDAFVWIEIQREAKRNQALQMALDHVILLYNLSKKDGNE